ncbi:hypothetical protein [Marinibactrum halimedae]|uniref:Uncharacterized protein n=1 Tax=Marinibactrum halimedae TaxID=1444977 RepID=A0AA37WNG3_9GAMM|nr:hypothetical protein [Marinibactrum halimedae]MCD9458093.1 hypothetical protein [Marinibactrum halimedae]GLS25027.1 hypothetical protein GCM10007877_07410 [Marinibactrum halimedae]
MARHVLFLEVNTAESSKENDIYFNSEAMLVLNNPIFYDFYKNSRGDRSRSHFYIYDGASIRQPGKCSSSNINFNLGRDDVLDCFVFSHGDDVGGDGRGGGDAWAGGWLLPGFIKKVSERLSNLRVKDRLENCVFMVCKMGSDKSISEIKTNIRESQLNCNVFMSRSYCFLDDYGRPVSGYFKDYEKLNKAVCKYSHNYQKLIEKYGVSQFDKDFSKSWRGFKVSSSDFVEINQSVVKSIWENWFGSDETHESNWGDQGFCDENRVLSDKQDYALKIMGELEKKTIRHDFAAYSGR